VLCERESRSAAFIHPQQPDLDAFGLDSLV
jgi:hypothetical protein